MADDIDIALLPIDFRAHAERADPRARESAPAAGRLSSEQVYRENCAWVIGAIRRRGVPEPDVLDVCQEIFEAVHARLPQFEGRSKLSTWLHSICHRKISDYWRKPSRRREVLHVGNVSEPTAPCKQEQRSIDQQRVTWLRQALAVLPEKQKQVFVMYEMEELPMPEIARILGCPPFTAYSRLHKARRRVQAFFDAREREAEGS